jgi:hypothetical protein
MQQKQWDWLPPAGTKPNTKHWLETGEGKRVRAHWTGEHWREIEGWEQDGREGLHLGPPLVPERRPDWRYCEPANA